jgi:hypothetical protein
MGKQVLWASRRELRSAGKQRLGIEPYFRDSGKAGRREGLDRAGNPKGDIATGAAVGVQPSGWLLAYLRQWEQGIANLKVVL